MQLERRRTIAAPPETVIALLTDVDQLRRLVPRAEQIEVTQRGEGRARLVVTVPVPRLGRQRIDGEARLLADGLRFIAVRPTEIDIRWTVRSAAGGSEAILQVNVDLAKVLGPLARLIPTALINRQVGDELETSLTALAELAAPPAPPAAEPAALTDATPGA